MQQLSEALAGFAASQHGLQAMDAMIWTLWFRIDRRAAPDHASAMTTLSLPAAERRPLIPILVALSVAHLLNDLLQSMIPALYPLIKETYRLDFVQIGLITLAFQVTSSLLQPLLGFLTDKRPWPYAMVAGMGATLVGLLTLAFAASYGMVLLAAALVGLGSAVFHPEATRMARHAAAGRQGLAQGLFQVGGHAGYAVGPLLAAAIVVPRGQASLAWFSIVVLIAMMLMSWTASRYSAFRRGQAKGHGDEVAGHGLSRGRVLFAMAILILLMVSKNGYTAAFSSYYTFYLISRFEVSVQLSQIMLFLYLAVSTFGVIIGGMVGDRIGRDRVIWLSIVGSLPFALMLPHADLFWTGVLSAIISFIMASAFSAILIYAIDLVPHRVGLVGGLFYGLAFGLAGVAAAVLGALADRIGIVEVFRICAWLPALGLLTFLLPKSARRG
jgi:FSR family fosmidomycin resistance protein-like MFS transporter